MTQSRKERNQLIIQEFRAHGGSVAAFAGTPLLLLTTIGAKSGQQHVTPVAYLADGDRLLIFAANGGRPRQPDWYHNLAAHPDVTVVVKSAKSRFLRNLAAQRYGIILGRTSFSSLLAFEVQYSIS